MVCATGPTTVTQNTDTDTDMDTASIVDKLMGFMWVDSHTIQRIRDHPDWSRLADWYEGVDFSSWTLVEGCRWVIHAVGDNVENALHSLAWVAQALLAASLMVAIWTACAFLGMHLLCNISRLTCLMFNALLGLFIVLCDAFLNSGGAIKAVLRAITVDMSTGPVHPKVLTICKARKAA